MGRHRYQSRGTHLVSTVARRAKCPDCRATVLSGLDEGIPVRVEPEPVDPAGELAALCDGRRTYGLVADGTLALRDEWRIRSGVGLKLYVEHPCGAR